jgi:hypothetical protein
VVVCWVWVGGGGGGAPAEPVLVGGGGGGGGGAPPLPRIAVPRPSRKMNGSDDTMLPPPPVRPGWLVNAATILVSARSRRRRVLPDRTDPAPRTRTAAPRDRGCARGSPPVLLNQLGRRQRSRCLPIGDGVSKRQGLVQRGLDDRMPLREFQNACRGAIEDVRARKKQLFIRQVGLERYLTFCSRRCSAIQSVTAPQDRRARGEMATP